MDKLTAFEKALIDKGLEEMIEIFKKIDDRLISEGKIPMITHRKFVVTLPA